MSDWQPIETAPKDGTAVLGYDPSDGYLCIYVVRWREGEWREAAGEEYGRWRPTHWMPLPSPPRKRKPAPMKERASRSSDVSGFS